jgi:hypothetical protein
MGTTLGRGRVLAEPLEDAVLLRTTAVYEALDERGQTLLDALEMGLSQWCSRIELEAHTRRRRLYSGVGLTADPSVLDRCLSGLDQSWREHVVRLV